MPKDPTELKIEKQKFQMFDKGLKEIASAIKEKETPEVQKISILGAELITIKGDKGDKGDLPSEEDLTPIITKLIPSPIPGKDGKDGNHGKDGLNGKNGKDGKSGLSGKNGTDGINGKDGKNGKDGSPDLPEQIVEKLLTVKRGWLPIDSIIGDFNERVDRRIINGAATSLKQLTDVDYSGLSQDANGNYILGSGGGGGTVGPGTTNEIAYFTSPTTIGSLTTTTYPSLTELSYVKGVTSAIQSQLNAKQTLYDTVGTIYNKTSFNSTILASDFVNSGATVAASGGSLNFSGGAGNFDQALGLSTYGYTALEHWKISSDVKVTGSGSGVGFGIRSDVVSGSTIDFVVQVNTSTGDINLGTNATTLATGSISFSLNDVLTISIERSANMMIAKVKNKTTNSAVVTVSALLTIPPYRTGYFSVFSFGGTFEVQNLNIYSIECKRPEYVVMGDSKSVAIVPGQTTYGEGYVAFLKNNFETVNLSCPGDATDEMLLRVPEVIAMNPKVVILEAGFNDIGRNSEATFEANYISIVSQLQAAGITVYHVGPLYSVTSSAAVATQTAFIASTYAANYIDCYTPMLANPSSVGADNIHPSIYGQELIYQTILNSGKVNKSYGQDITTNNAYIQNGNGNTVSQDASFYVNKASIVAAPLTVGNATPSMSQFIIKTDSDSRIQFFTSSSETGIWASNNAGSTTQPLNLYASQLTVNNLSAELLKLSTAGALRLNKYGVGTFSGTATKNLAVDVNGNVIEVATGGGGSGTVTSVASADGSITVTNPTTTVDLAVVKAPKLTTARTIGGVSFDGTVNITVATATGGFTVSGGDLVLGANNLTMTGSLGATGARLTKGWFTDLQVTNAIAGSITGNAATATALQNARTIAGVSFDGTANIAIASTNLSDTAKIVLTDTNQTITGIKIFSPTARASGTAAYLTINTPADTGITASTEAIGVNYATGTRTWADGTVVKQREFLFQAPTYNKTTTSSTFTTAATLSVSGAPIAGTGVTITNAYSMLIEGTNARIGTPAAGTPNSVVGGRGLEVTGTDNSVGGMNLTVANTSNGTSAFADLFLQNDLADATGTHYGVVNLNSSTYSDTTFGTALAVANQMSIYGTDGPTMVGSFKASTGAVNFIIGGSAATNEIGRFTTTGLTVGLTGTLTGAITFAGATSTSIKLQGQAVGSSGVLTLPAVTDTLVGKATTDAFTNKTFNTAATGNVFQINGTGITAITGSGSVVLATSPTIATSIITASTSFTAFAGATTLLTIGGTGATSVFAIPGTLEQSTTTGALTVAGGVYIAKKLRVVGNITADGAVINTNNAITASGNAATVPITAKLNTVTNNSAATLTITMTTGAVDGQMTIVRILDFSAAAQTITWVNTENSTVTAPTTSNGSTTLFLTVGFIYNSGTSKWRCIASA